MDSLLFNWTHSGESFESSLKNFWASKELRQLRYQLLEGRWPSACEVCEHLEKNGMPSDRIVHWKLQKQLGLAESITYDLYTGNEHAQPLTLDVRPSNVCNLKCRMCTASNSSRIQQELDSHSELKQFSKDISDRWPQSKPASDFFNGQVWNKNIRALKLLGGEPSVDPSCIRIMRNLVESGASRKIELSITTNAIVFTDDFLD